MTARALAGPLLLLCGAAVCIEVHAAAPSRQEFEAWKAQRASDYAEHLSKQDREFSDFLKQTWVATRGIGGEFEDRTPKPVAPPKVVERPPVALTPPVKLPPAPPPAVFVAPRTPTAPPAIPAPLPTPPAAPTPAPTPTPSPAPTLRPAVPLPQPPIAPPPAPAGLKVGYFGREITLPFAPKGLDARVAMGGSRPDAIADYWARAAAAASGPLFDALRATRTDLTLDDWPSVVLIGRYAKAVHPDASPPQRDDDAVLLSWFMLCRAGFDARVAYHDGGVLLLVRSAEDLFDTPYLALGGARYYAAPLDGRRRAIPANLYTFEGTCPGEVRPIDFRFRHGPQTAGRLMPRELKTDLGGRNYKVSLDYDPDLVDLLGTWPQMKIDSYFAASVPPELAASWSRALRPLLEGRSESEAVDLLLALLQHGMPYQTDEQQFGREEYLFPVETLRYPAADCEDRAVLLAWLVRNLLGLDVVGLDFPGHVAVAVRFDAPVAGDAVDAVGGHYLVSDPTYIGAGVGQAMPGFPLARARIVAIER